MNIRTFRIRRDGANRALNISTMADAHSMRAVGSSTVYPFAEAVAERVARANSALGTPVIESTGTGGGMKLFCAGIRERFPDVANASRRMKASKRKPARPMASAQITEIQNRHRRHRVRDGERLAACRRHDPRHLYPPSPRPVWQAHPRQDVEGRQCQLPAIPIRVYGPPPTSGTRDALVELIPTAGCESNAGMAALKEGRRRRNSRPSARAVREDGGFVEAGENDNLIVQKLTANPARSACAVTASSKRSRQAEGCPSTASRRRAQAISSFKYPGARPL